MKDLADARCECAAGRRQLSEHAAHADPAPCFVLRAPEHLSCLQCVARLLCCCTRREIPRVERSSTR